MRKRLARNLAISVVTLIGVSAIILAFVDVAESECLSAGLYPEPPSTVGELVQRTEVAVTAHVRGLAEERRQGATAFSVFALEVEQVVATRLVDPPAGGDTVLLIAALSPRGPRLCDEPVRPAEGDRRLYLLERVPDRTPQIPPTHEYFLAERHGHPHRRRRGAVRHG